VMQLLFLCLVFRHLSCPIFDFIIVKLYFMFNQLGHSDVEKFLQAPDNILKTAYNGLYN
jgi:hypothetical protein